VIRGRPTRAPGPPHDAYREIGECSRLIDDRSPPVPGRQFAEGRDGDPFHVMCGGLFHGLPAYSAVERRRRTDATVMPQPAASRPAPASAIPAGAPVNGSIPATRSDGPPSPGSVTRGRVLS